MKKFLFKVTTYYQGQTDTHRVFAPDKKTALKQLRKAWFPGVVVLSVEQEQVTLEYWQIREGLKS